MDSPTMRVRLVQVRFSRPVKFRHKGLGQGTAGQQVHPYGTLNDNWFGGI